MKCTKETEEPLATGKNFKQIADDAETAPGESQ